MGFVRVAPPGPEEVLMNKILGIIILIAVVLSVPLLLDAQEDRETKELTLEECIVKALKNNLTVKIQVLNPEISHQSLRGAWEKYFPTMSFSYGKSKTDSPSYSWLDASDTVQTESNSWSAQFSQALPIGGTFSVSVDNSKYDTNRSFQTINPRFNSTIRFTLNQPLLKGFGVKTANKEIRVARNNRSISRQQFRSTLMETVYNVEDAYWNLVYSIGNLKVSQQSLDLAKEQLRKNKRSVEVGVLAPIEIKNAEAEVATREADILQAEASVRSAEEQLKRIINFDMGADEGQYALVPVDEPKFKERPVELKNAIKTAFEFRPDLEQSRLSLKNRKIEYGYTKNQLLPDLSLQASYWSPGVSGTRIIYQDGDPLTGIIVDTIPGAGGDALKDALKILYPNWSFSLNLSIPLANIVSRSQFKLARMQMKQTELQLLDTQQQVLLDIKTAVRNVRTNYKRVLAYRLARELTEKKLEAEEQKLKVGNSTNFQVFLTQRDLANARSSELRAVIDYNLSLAYFDKALGVTLKEKNIKLDEVKPE